MVFNPALRGIIYSLSVALFRYSSMGRQEQTRFLSPYTSSRRPTAGQSLFSLIHLRGKAAFSLEYGCSHLSPPSPHYLNHHS
ncbi:MAG: hypothetical protein L0922_05810, partial [Candidatus Mariimomonas ferrooxydans]